MLSRFARPRRTALTVGHDGLRHLDSPIGPDLVEHVLSGQRVCRVRHRRDFRSIGFPAQRQLPIGQHVSTAMSVCGLQ